MPSTFVDKWILLVLGDDWATKWGAPGCYVTVEDIELAFQASSFRRRLPPPAAATAALAAAAAATAG